MATGPINYQLPQLSTAYAEAGTRAFQAVGWLSQPSWASGASTKMRLPTGMNEASKAAMDALVFEIELDGLAVADLQILTALVQELEVRRVNGDAEFDGPLSVWSLVR